MRSIKKVFKCEYAHRLYSLIGTDSPCQNLHGHSARIEVILFTNKLDNHAMVIDFTKLRSIQIWIDDHFDHATILNEKDFEMINALNSIIDKPNSCLKPLYLLPSDPTAEVLSEIICEKVVVPLVKAYDLPINKIKVTFYETANNSASYEN